MALPAVGEGEDGKFVDPSLPVLPSTFISTGGGVFRYQDLETGDIKTQSYTYNPEGYAEGESDGALAVDTSLSMDVALDYFNGNEALLDLTMSLGAGAYADGTGQIEAFADFLNTASLESIQFQDENGDWVDADALGLTLTSVPGLVQHPFLPLLLAGEVRATPEPGAMVSWAVMLAAAAGYAYRRRRPRALNIAA